MDDSETIIKVNVDKYAMREWIDIVLAESISTPFPYEWDTQTQHYWHATFTVDGEEYFITADKLTDFPHPDDNDRDGDWYDLAFGITRDGFAGSRVLNTGGQAFRIFSTAIAAFEEFVRTVAPELIMLSASKENDNRFPLYQRMARRFSSDLTALGYRSVAAPENRHVATAKYFDTLAWQRS